VVNTGSYPAGARITADIEAVLDSKVAYLEDWVRQGGAENGAWVSDLSTTYDVLASAHPGGDAGAGFVSIRIDYHLDARFADAGPQWIDVIDWDLETGNRISISDLFTDTTTAIQRISRTVGADPNISQWFDPSLMLTSGWEPKVENFELWAPTPTGLQITFSYMQLGSAVSGTPSTIVPWYQVQDLVRPNSYLAWYLATLS